MNYYKLLTTSVLVFFLFSCQTEEVIDNLQEPRTIQVLALDPELAGAVVYEDINDNAILDASEKFAFTDVDGYVSYNPKKNIDYCLLSTSHIHCFQLLDEDTTIRIANGYDTRSRGKNDLQLKLDYKVNQVTDTRDSVVVSPLSSLPSIAVDYNNNFLELESDEDRTDLGNAINVHSVLSSMGGFLLDKFPAYGSNDSLPNDLGHILYATLDELLSTSEISNISLLTSDDVLLIINGAETKIKSEYASLDLDAASVSDADKQRLSQNIGSISSVVDLVTEDDSTEVLLTVMPLLAHVLSQKAQQQTVAQFASDIDFITSAKIISGADQTLVEVLANQQNLINTDVLQTMQFAEIIQAELVLEDVSHYPSLVSKRIDLNFSGDAVDSRILVDFTGGESDGDINICIKYESSSSQFQLLETSGSHIAGSWSLQTPNQIVTYIEFGETAFPFRIIKLSDTKYQVDYDGVLRDWSATPVNGSNLPDIPESIQYSSSTCEVALDS